MKHVPFTLAVLTIALLALWGWDLSRGPGAVELLPQPPFPEPLAAWVGDGPGRTLTGTITRADGAAAERALVQIDGTNGLYWTRTDALGRFTLSGLPTERAPRTATVLAYEHLPERFDLPPDADSVTWQLAPAPAELEALPELVLSDYTGRVERADGPTEGLEVWLVPPPGTDLLTGMLERRATVAADGSFAVPGLAAGVYQAHVLPAWARGATWPLIGSGAVSVAVGSSLPDPPALVVREGALRGTVTLGAAGPVAGAMVLLQDATDANRLCPPRATDANGGFAFDGLPAGTYRLDVLSGLEQRVVDVVITTGKTVVQDFNLGGA